MSLAMSQHNFEVIVGKPNKDEPEKTREKMLAGIAIQRQHPDFIGIPLEGVKVEDETATVRILEWTSYEGHMHNFRGSSSYQEFSKIREGSSASAAYMSHYNFYGPLPLNPMPPIVEYLAFSLKPDMSFDSFLPEYTMAIEPVVGLSTGFAVGRQVEDPTKILVLVAWKSVEAHLVDTRNVPKFQENRDVMTLVYEKYVQKARDGLEVWHIKTCEPGMAV